MNNTIASKNTAPVAVFYDDQYGTIDNHTQLAKEHEVEVIKAKDVNHLLELMDEYSDTAIFFIDMFMPNIVLPNADVIDIEQPNFSAAIFLYLYFLITRKKRIRFAYILSGRPLEEPAINTLSDLEDEDYVIDYVKKDNVGDFGEKISSFKADFFDNNSKIDTIETNRVPSNSEAMNKFSILSHAYAELSKEEDKDGFLKGAFGYGLNTNATIDDIRTHFTYAMDSDFVDINTRFTVLAFIKSSLNRLFGEDGVDLQKKWVYTYNDDLNAMPKDLILTGDLNNLFLISNLLDRVVN